MNVMIMVFLCYDRGILIKSSPVLILLQITCIPYILFTDMSVVLT